MGTRVLINRLGRRLVVACLKFARWALLTAVIGSWSLWAASFLVGWFIHPTFTTGRDIVPWQLFFVDGQLCVQSFPRQESRIRRILDRGVSSGDVRPFWDFWPRGVNMNQSSPGPLGNPYWDYWDMDVDLSFAPETKFSEATLALVDWTEAGGANWRFAGFLTIDAGPVRVLRIPAYAVGALPALLSALQAWLWLASRATKRGGHAEI